MKFRLRTLRILGLGVLLCMIFILATAAVGWWREKNDVQTIRALLATHEKKIRSKLTEVGDGIQLKRFNELFPNAYFDESNKEWSVSIPTGYDENPYCINIRIETITFRMDGEVIRPAGIGVGGKHCDRFGIGGIWYYFCRAWYSSADEYDE